MKLCCDILERAVVTPGSPLAFDRVYREVSLKIAEYLFDVRYCPFCGKVQQESLRSTFFAEVTKEESDRVIGLLRGCYTKASVVERLGPADWEHQGGEHYDTFFAQKISFPPTLIYKKLSATTALRITLASDDSILKISTEARCLRPEDTA